jgi:hypothetical protein
LIAVHTVEHPFFMYAACLVNIEVEWIQGYNRWQVKTPHLHEIEYYKEPSAQTEPKGRLPYLLRIPRNSDV